MTLEEFKNILEATEFPVAYSHFFETENEPLPEPPFICYLITDSANLMADNRVYKSFQNLQIELYTNKKDFNAESKLESLLQQHEIPYETMEIFIESEQLFQKIYEVRLVQNA